HCLLAGEDARRQAGRQLAEEPVAVVVEVMEFVTLAHHRSPFLSARRIRAGIGHFRTPIPRMKRSRICTGSWGVGGIPGWPSMCAPINVGAGADSDASANRSKSSSSAAHALLARPHPCAT